jgi:predicted lipoprotein with Yx(FWY)xxD motif
MRYRMAGAVGVAAIGLTLAACSSGGSSTAASSPSSSSPSAASAPASSSAPSAPASSSAPSAPASSSAPTVSLGSVSGIPGKFLVGSDGKTLYLFEADKGTKSACTGACAQAWPYATVTGTPTAGSGVNKSLLGTTKAPDGSTQLTYGGHPLYYFVADTGSGTAKGQNSKAFGAGWYVVAPTGKKIDTD